MSVSAERQKTRQDTAWAIAVGGIIAISFAALLIFAWEFAATLFLIFSGILLGVALTAMTNLLKKVMPGPHAGRLVLICLLLAAMMAGISTGAVMRKNTCHSFAPRSRAASSKAMSNVLRRARITMIT